MGQDYPLTDPSPGPNPPIYPSTLPLTCGNKLSNIFPKNHGFCFLCVCVCVYIFTRTYSIRRRTPVSLVCIRCICIKDLIVDHCTIDTVTISCKLGQDFKKKRKNQWLLWRTTSVKSLHTLTSSWWSFWVGCHSVPWVFFWEGQSCVWFFFEEGRTGKRKCQGTMYQPMIGVSMYDVCFQTWRGVCYHSMLCIVVSKTSWKMFPTSGCPGQSELVMSLVSVVVPTTWGYPWHPSSTYYWRHCGTCHRLHSVVPSRLHGTVGVVTYINVVYVIWYLCYMLFNVYWLSDTSGLGSNPVKKEITWSSITWSSLGRLSTKTFFSSIFCHLFFKKLGKIWFN